MMRMLRCFNLALVAAALTVAAWSGPAAANGERPSGATVSQKAAGAGSVKKVRRAAVRKRVAMVPRLPALPSSRWVEGQVQQAVAQIRLLMVGVGY